MNPNPTLDHMIAKETAAEILATLTPQQLAVVALRLDGIPFILVSEILGFNRQNAYQRMNYARVKLLETFPHIRSWVLGP